MTHHKWVRMAMIGAAWLAACGWIGYAATAARCSVSSVEPAAQKPIDASVTKQDYVDHPEPLYQGNKNLLEQLRTQKTETLQKIKLADNQTIMSSELTTWGVYVQADGENAQNNEIDDNRVVWTVTIDCPDGLYTKGGTFLKATMRLVIDAETGKLFEKVVDGERDWNTINPAIRNLGDY